jgi:hypothetical protein
MILKLMPFKMVLLFSISGLLLRAEDWTTNDGKVFKNVKVLSHDAGSVVILDEDGGATVELSRLSPDIQKRFNYDSAKAAEAVAASQAQAAKDLAALAAQERATDAKKQANLQALALSDPVHEAPKHTTCLLGSVAQKIPGGGLIVECSATGAPDDATGGWDSEYDMHVFMLKGMPSEADLVDRDAIREEVYRSGSFSYTTPEGVRKTIAAYTAVGPYHSTAVWVPQTANP